MLTSNQLAARQVLPKELPQFGGDPADWGMFYHFFCMSTQQCGFSDMENILRLQRSLKGSALAAVRSMLLMSTDVNSIIKTLEMRFGRPEQMIFTLIEKIRSELQIRPDNLNQLIDFGLLTKNLVATMKGTNQINHLNNPMLLYELVGKLPTNLKLDWGRYIVGKEPANLEIFSDWLYRLTEAACIVTPIKSNIKLESNERRGNVHQRGLHGYHQSSVCCPACKNTSTEHKLSECKEFIEMPRKEKWNIIKQNHLCAHCLIKHRHPCKKICGENGCEKRHNKILHVDQFEHKKEIIPDPNSANINIHSTKLEDLPQVLLRIVPVTLYNGKFKITTFALLDEGSTISLIDEELANEIKLVGQSSNLCLMWSSDISRVEEKSKSVQFEISGKDMSTIFKMDRVRTVKDLSLGKHTMSVNRIKKYYKYLSSVPVSGYINAVPKLLIGADHLNLSVSLQTIEGYVNEPIATRTRLGWVIGGPTKDGKAIVSGAHNFHQCNCSDKILHESLQEYFSLENFGVKNSSLINDSNENIKSYEIMKSSTRLVEGRYETGLLWRYNNIKLPDSLFMAKKRLICLEKKMEIDPVFASKLKLHIQDYEQKGYIRKLSSEEINGNEKTWYLPIFVVKNPNKPEKFRVVWDAAAKVDGISLNDMLMKGPDLLTPLQKVLLCFREYPIAITGDIREMFHQIRVKGEDQNVQRFLWRDGDRSKEPDVFVMRVMTFGASCSPTLAQYIKNENAKRFQQEFPRAVNAILNHHYVDDWLGCFSTKEEALQTAKDVRFIHQSGGFEIRNWNSNSVEVLQELGIDTRTDNVLLCEKMDKVLGMWWCPSTDIFTFKISNQIKNLLISDYHPTKREVLRTLMSTYDPLGLIAHFTVQLKFLLHNIWQSSVDWDEKIIYDHYELWKRWLNLLPTILNSKINRCYSKKLCSKTLRSTELHIFVDASANGYAAVAYIKVEDEEGVDVSLICVKTKVAPQKMLSIPRLELLAAMLGTRLAQSIQTYHNIKFDQRVFWSDSMTVLTWLRSTQRRFRQFVAFRIGEILENSHVSEWRWISSKINIADVATKWKFQQGDIQEWYNGPNFLKLESSEWEKEPNHEVCLPQEEFVMSHQEIKYVVPDIPNVNNISKWTVLKNSASYIIRFINNLKRTMRKEVIIVGPLKKHEVESGEINVIKAIQWEFFKDEIISLKKSCEVKNCSSIKSYLPFLDDVGIMRAKGRTSAAPYATYEQVNPIILPRQHRATELLVAHYHQHYHHINHETAINQLRQLFIIPKLRVVMKLVKKNCQWCKIQKAEPIPPVMGNLPYARLAIYNKPFSYTGVDLFGPIEVTVGRRSEKRWGVIFTCLTVRAIHIELVSSLQTDIFIMCLRRFFARRGTPIEIHSDNGTNFKGAYNEIKDLIIKVDFNVVQAEYTNIKWKFIPPSAPHMGGCWERLIRSIKRSLYTVLPTRKPSEELLVTVLCEIESIINSRPLTYVPVDSVDHTVLTPNHFLLGSSDGSKPAIEFDNNVLLLRKNWRKAQKIADLFWKKWILEYMPSLTRRVKWYNLTNPIKEGDIVLIVDEQSPRYSWPKGKVIKTIVNPDDGQIRQAVVQTSKGLYKRPVVKLAVLDVGKSDDISSSYQGPGC